MFFYIPNDLTYLFSTYKLSVRGLHSASVDMQILNNGILMQRLNHEI